MSPVSPGYHATQTLLLHLARRDGEDDINCAVCLKWEPEWTFSFRVRVSAARATAGLCERCRVTLQAGLSAEIGGRP